MLALLHDSESLSYLGSSVFLIATSDGRVKAVRREGFGGRMKRSLANAYNASVLKEVTAAFLY